jgi:hypothetical protein
MLRMSKRAVIAVWHSFDLVAPLFTMAKIAIVFCCLLLPAVYASSQDHVEPAQRDLVWNEFYKLQWDDFQGKPDANSLGDAGAAVQIKAKPFMINDDIEYDVAAIFSRSKSWMRDMSPELLAHEQLHFDIAELYARKIRQKVKELHDRKVNNIKVYNKAIQELLLESNLIDEQYDTETLHGALSKRQDAWSKKVKNELAGLKEYKKVRRVIRR